MKRLFRKISIICCLGIYSGLSQGAHFTIPVNMLYFNPDQTGNYLFPKSGFASALCSENQNYGRRYTVSGHIGGPSSHGFVAEINKPAYVTLYERNGRATAQIKITPLGVHKLSNGTYRIPGSVRGTGTLCARSTEFFNTYGEKTFASDGSVYMSITKQNQGTVRVNLAFELLDPESVVPGYYSARGGYQFSVDQVRLRQSTSPVIDSSPLIPDLQMVVRHVFQVDVPYPAVSLTQTHADADTFTGNVRFTAQSNERYSITMNCSNSGSTSGGDCYFDGTEMELSTVARFPVQNQSYTLKHGAPVYIDGTDFTESYNGYHGFLDFKLSKVGQYGEAGKSYFDTVSLVFEADF